MKAISDLFSSEKGFVGVLILIAATVLAALDRMTIDQWSSLIQVVFATYVVGKTAQGVAAVVANRKAAPVAAPDEAQSNGTPGGAA